MGSPAILGFQPRPLGLKLGARRPSRRLVYSLLFVLAVLSYIFYTHPQAFEDHIWWRIQEGHLYAMQYTRYNFKPTFFEQQCFDGTAARVNSHNLTDTIPETVHFIWIGNSEISFKLYLSIRAAIISTGVMSVHLHHDTPLNGDNGWLRLLQRNLTFVPFDRSDYLTEVAAYQPETWRTTHQTDIVSSLQKHFWAPLEKGRFPTRACDLQAFMCCGPGDCCPFFLFANGISSLL